jgi:hypothetical protein
MMVVTTPQGVFEPLLHALELYKDTLLNRITIKALQS